jgi:hypothetical protein
LGDVLPGFLLSQFHPLWDTMEDLYE